MNPTIYIITAWELGEGSNVVSVTLDEAVAFEEYQRDEHAKKMADLQRRRRIDGRSVQAWRWKDGAYVPDDVWPE